MSKLLPCPFCEGEAFTHMLGNEIAKGYYIACDECGAKTIVFGYEAEAIKAWNRRAETTTEMLMRVLAYDATCGVCDKQKERTAKVQAQHQVGDHGRVGSCGACGAPVIKPDKYCSKCGAKLDWSE